MTLTRTKLVLLSAALLLPACRTAPIGPPLEAPVPAGLSRADAEVAIATLLTAPADRRRDPNTHALVVTNPLGGILWDQYRDAAVRSKHWFLENWEEGRIVAGYQKNQHYMRVPIVVSDSTVTLSIAESRHLRQSRGRIHKNAKVWLERLETDIRDALGRAAVAQRRLRAEEQDQSTRIE